MRGFSAVVLLIILSVFVLPNIAIAAKKDPFLIERIEADLAKDKAFTPDERDRYAEEFRQQLAAYANDILKGDKAAGADVLMRIVMEGSFDGAPIERTVEIAATAYIAISRGSTPDVVEGIALYGFRKKISADKIEAWANGYNECIKFGVPAYIGEDLVFQAAEHDEWDIYTYNTLKWGLVDAVKAGYDVEDFQAYLMVNFIKSKEGAGSVVASSLAHFRRAKQSGQKPAIPIYRGSFIPRKEQLKAKPEPAKSEPVAPQTAQAQTSESKQAEKPAPSKEESKQAEPVKPEPAKTKTKEKAKPAPVKPAPPVEKAEKEKVEEHASIKGAIAWIWEKLEGAVQSFLGTPYVWGGETRTGTDCSGFVRSVYRDAGIKILRTSREQWTEGRPVDGELKQWDLVFFKTIGDRISHVGIVVEPKSQKFAHASSSKGVTYEKLETRYFKARYAGARRIMKDNGEKITEADIMKAIEHARLDYRAMGE